MTFDTYLKFVLLLFKNYYIKYNYLIVDKNYNLK